MLELALPISPRPEFLPEAVYDKIVADPIAEEIKNDFLAACEECDCETGDAAESLSIETVYNNFAADLQDTGIPVTLDEGERLGRVTNLRNAAEYLATRLDQDVADVVQMFGWLDELSDPGPTARQASIAEEWLSDLKDAINPDTGEPFAISPPICWLFRSAEGSHNATEDMDGSGDCLPCRLGLPDLLIDAEVYERDLDYLCMGVSAGGVENPRLSNFCHGGYIGVRDIWAPGGLTVPIPYGPAECVAQGGLPEIISDAVPYRFLDGPLRIVRT